MTTTSSAWGCHPLTTVGWRRPGLECIPFWYWQLFRYRYWYTIYWYWLVGILVSISRCACLSFSLFYCIMYVCCIVSYVHIFRGKWGSRQFLIPKSTDQVFLWYQFGKYWEILTKYWPKILNQYTSLAGSWFVVLYVGSQTTTNNNNDNKWWRKLRTTNNDKQKRWQQQQQPTTTTNKYNKQQCETNWAQSASVIGRRWRSYGGISTCCPQSSDRGRRNRSRWK